MATKKKAKETEIGPEIVHALPPVWDSVCLAFGVIPKTAVFTYGNKIFNPSGNFMPDHIIAHETVHMDQQARLVPHDAEKCAKMKDPIDLCTCGAVEQGAALWWGKFLRDAAFRLDQESEAYAVQFAFVCEVQRDRNTRARFLIDLARVLSGPIYGHVITTSEAQALIRRRSGITN